MEEKKKPWWMCNLEEYFWENPEWELIHDGQRNPGQFEFPPDDIRCFTRRYKCIGKSGLWGIVWGITFQYDLRSGGADVTKVEFSSEDSRHKKKKDVFELVHSKGGT